MTKKIWKLTPEAVDFIISVCPTPEKALELILKADTIFNADQDVASFEIASLNSGEILECKATLKLWRDECAELVEVDDDFKAAWEIAREKIVAFVNGEDDDDEAVEDKKDNE